MVLLVAAIAFHGSLDHTGRIREADLQLLTTNVENQLFSSTIQISMIMVDRNGGDGGSELYAWRGLGTLIEYGGSLFILTHGHWPVPSPGLIAVELRDSVGKRLLLIEANAFLKLLRYHDRGTMIVEVSQQFSGVTPATLGNSSDVTTDDTVLLAHTTRVR